MFGFFAKHHFGFICTKNIFSRCGIVHPFFIDFHLTVFRSWGQQPNYRGPEPRLLLHHQYHLSSVFWVCLVVFNPQNTSSERNPKQMPEPLQFLMWKSSDPTLRSSWLTELLTLSRSGESSNCMEETDFKCLHSQNDYFGHNQQFVISVRSNGVHTTADAT